LAARRAARTLHGETPNHAGEAMTASSQRPMTLHGVPLSVHTRKVILAARIKSIPYELNVVIPVVPDNPPPTWRSISPTGLIPAIDDRGYVLADSTAIVLYLERKVAEPALLPARLEDYGRALFLDAWAGGALYRAAVHPLFHHQVVGPGIHKTPGDQRAIDAALTRAAPEAFGYLESLAPEAFLVGDALSIADLAVVSNLLVFHYLGHRVDRYPRLHAYFQRHLDSPLIRDAVQDERPFADNMGLDRSFLA
jgi:glutathione S-transferase